MMIFAEVAENKCINPFSADPEISRPATAMPQMLNTS